MLMFFRRQHEPVRNPERTISPRRQQPKRRPSDDSPNESAPQTKGVFIPYARANRGFERWRG